MSLFHFDPVEYAADAQSLRTTVRSLIDEKLQEMPAAKRAQSWTGFDASFSEYLGAAGFIGMHWPAHHGGRDCPAIERYIVIEELLAAGAPVGAHWIADRQSGAHLISYASPSAQNECLPGIASGKLFFCIGMSEPNSGSDLASITTRAVRVDGGWRIRGAKLWTTHVTRAHMMIALVRTSDGGDSRHQGLSQFLIDLSLDGVTINGITDQTGDQHFGEVFLDDVFVTDDCLIGTEGEGWQQVNHELALERSGPERYLSSYRLIPAYLDALQGETDDISSCALGEIVAELWTLRQMSMSVAAQISNGADPVLEAAMVKDLGATFEQELPHRIQACLAYETDNAGDEQLTSVLDYLLNAAPSFSLRGGTREILRGIIARGLGLR